MSLSTLSEPDCRGMCSCGMTLGVSAMASMTSSVNAAGCGLVNRTRSKPFDFTAGAQEFGERLPVAEFHAVGVHVLAQERDFDRAVVHERLDFGEDVAGAAVLFLAAQSEERCRTCRCCCSPRRWTPSPNRPSPAWWGGWTGRHPGTPGSPAGLRCCAGPGPGGRAALRRCGCRRRRPPRAPSSGWFRGPSGPGIRLPQSACPGLPL